MAVVSRVAVTVLASHAGVSRQAVYIVEAPNPVPGFGRHAGQSHFHLATPAPRRA